MERVLHQFRIKGQTVTLEIAFWSWKSNGGEKQLCSTYTSISGEMPCCLLMRVDFLEVVDKRLMGLTCSRQQHCL